MRAALLEDAEVVCQLCPLSKVLLPDAFDVLSKRHPVDRVSTEEVEQRHENIVEENDADDPQEHEDDTLR